MAEQNWHPISEAPQGIGPLLLRAGQGPLDPSYVGYQGADGRWLDSDNREAHPTHYCLIPQFDADDDDGAAS